MTFYEAETEVIGLFKNSVSRIQMGYTKWVAPREDVQCSVIVVYPGLTGKAQSFHSSTWRGVINKIRIFLEPSGLPTSEEAPQENAEGAGEQQITAALRLKDSAQIGEAPTS
jgi:hypothetical protein